MAIGLLLKHWKGHNPVITSVFGICVLGLLLFFAIGRVILLVFPSDMPLEIIAKIELIRLVSWVVVLGWAVVGTWRSAGHATRGVKWATRAAIFCTLILGAPPAARTGEYALELLRLASQNDPMGPPAQVTVNDRQIKVLGTLSQGTADKFLSVLQAMPDVESVILNSRGGRLREALVMAAAIKDRRLDTIAMGQCESACTMLVLAGVRRYAFWDAKIGFHQATVAGNSAVEDRLASSDIKETFLIAGISASFVEKAFSTSSRKMWYPSQELMFQSGFLTRAPLNWQMKMIASETSTILPIRLDSLTTLRKVHVIDTAIFFTYDLEQAQWRENIIYLQRFANKLAHRELCGRIKTKRIIAQGGIIVRRYYDKAGNFLIQTVVNSC
jgi:hypothetical protein